MGFLQLRLQDFDGFLLKKNRYVVESFSKSYVHLTEG